MLTVHPYSLEFKNVWDDFVKASRNATFLHQRGYMEYHSDRFTDASLILRDAKGNIAALLPANRKDCQAVSHGGLTYGGLLLSEKTDVMMVCEAFAVIKEYYRGIGMKELIYKPIPTIYDRMPSQEDRYALFLSGAQPTVVNISSAVELQTKTGYNENTRRNIRKALKEGVTVESSTDIESFHRILSELLASRYETVPVHTLSELSYLTSLFPTNIRLMMAYRCGHPIAGSLLYVTDTVTHTQYIAANEEGKSCDALSLLFDISIQTARKEGQRYFDFGTSNGDGGHYLNTGLIRQKNGFGGRGIAYPSYKIIL